MVQHWFTAYLTDYYSRKKNVGLDIGCGKQPYRRNYNCKYVGIDIPHDKMEHVKPDFFGSGDSLPFKNNSFDFITCFSVIPYIEKIDEFFNEMYRVTKNNGIVVITIMNLKALSCDRDGYYSNRFSSSQLEKKFKKHGFKSIKSTNLKALFWSTYFNTTSVYSYAIVKCVKKNSILDNSQNKSIAYSDKPSRQSIRTTLIRTPKLYSISKYAYRKYCDVTQCLHTVPNFLIIGAAKSGTSSLYDYLMQHPHVGKSLTKQIHFFDRYFDRKVSWYKVCFPFIWKKFMVEKIQSNKFVTGEATAHYMTHPLAAKRAFSVIPNAKIIVMLRNPVDRAYSHYQMEKEHKKDELSFEDAIEKEPERIKGEFEQMLNNENNSGRNYPHRSYIKSGEYLEQIQRWREFYPKENFMYITSEEFNKNPSLVYNDALKFLELSPFELPKYEKIRSRKYDKMNSETRKKLIKYFKPHNERLSEYLNITFDWNK